MSLVFFYDLPILCPDDHGITSNTVAGLVFGTQDLCNHFHHLMMGNGIVSPTHISLEEQKRKAVSFDRHLTKLGLSSQKLMLLA